MDGDVPAEPDRSQVVSTDVADVIEGLMSELVYIFAGSDEVVKFEPVGPNDEAEAQQEMDYVDHVFMQRNPDFVSLYFFIKDAAFQGRNRQGVVVRARGRAARNLGMGRNLSDVIGSKMVCPRQRGQRARSNGTERLKLRSSGLLCPAWPQRYPMTS
jgi:hypothetical protein